MEQPLVKILFTGKSPNLILARRLPHFSKNWEKLTLDQDILSVVKGYVIPFLKVLVQKTVPKQVRVSKTQELLIDQDIVEMLEKRAIEKWNILSQANSRAIFSWYKRKMGEVVIKLHKALIKLIP